MSSVFVAEETSLGRRVVIKILPPELAQAVSGERFRQEIRFAARLTHPHIVPLLTAGESDGLPYYTMPYVEGESLRARLARGALPDRRGAWACCATWLGRSPTLTSTASSTATSSPTTSSSPAAPRW